MQLIACLSRRTGLVFLALGASLLMGCDRSPVAAMAHAAQSAPAAQAVKGRSYDLVIEVHSDDITAENNFARGAYDLCVMILNAQGTQPAPFVPVSSGFLFGRTRYVSDGKSYYVIEQQYGRELASPENRCATPIGHTTTTHLFHDGKYQSVDTSGTGEVVATPVLDRPSLLFHDRDRAVSGYTVPRTIKGKNYLCIPQQPTTVEACIDGQGVKSPFFGGSGEAIVLYETNHLLPGGTSRVKEVTQAVTDEPVDASLFKWAKETP